MFLFVGVFLIMFLIGSVSALDIANNTWVTISPDQINFPPGFESGSYQSRGWCKMIYRAATQSIIYYEGYMDSGGDPRGPSIYANTLYSFDIDTKILTALKISNWEYDYDYGTDDFPIEPDNTLDPTPANRHTYGKFAYVPSEDAIYIVGGANSRGGGDAVLDLNDIWKY